MADSKRSMVHILRIALDEIQPTVWRRLAIPSSFNLGRLHKCIQASMPWTDSHLHVFVIDDIQYSDPKLSLDEREPVSKTRDEHKFKLSSVFPRRMTARYIYDFGDAWEHENHVEDIRLAQDGMAYPVCLEGEQACPPEDCGGAVGYFEYLEQLKVTGHPERDQAKAWQGGDYNPKKFNLGKINAALLSLGS